MSPVLTTPVPATGRDDCAATAVLRRVGDKWSVLLLALLSDRAYGFNELDRTVDGLSRRVLTRTLRGLEADRLITRTVHAGRVAYQVSALGRSLMPHVIALGTWAEEHRAELGR